MAEAIMINDHQFPNYNRSSPYFSPTGTFTEFMEVAPLFSTPSEDSDFVFELIIPAIPGFAFSSVPKKPGFHHGQCAKIFKKLMNRLGFSKFYIQLEHAGH